MQAKELLKLEEFRSGNMPQALGRAFLRMDELLVQEKHLEELKTLAGPKEKRYEDVLPCASLSHRGPTDGCPGAHQD